MMGDFRRVLATAYEKLGVPSFPKSGEMQNWMLAFGQACCIAGGYIDRLELQWLKECWGLSVEDLRDSTSGGRWTPTERWVNLDMRVAGV